MNIVVCVKQTFDTEEKLVIEQGEVSEDNVKYVINPYDEYGIEEALRQRDAAGEGTVTVITAGPERAESALRTALAMGADRAVHICDAVLDGSDEFVVAQVLAAAIKRQATDLVIAGYMAIDSGAGQGGPRLAELLDLPHISTVIQLDIQADQVTAERETEGDREIVMTQLPLLVTTQQGLNEPRYPSLPGIMKARKKPIERLSCADLKLDAELLASRTRLLDQCLPPARAIGKKLSGTPAEAAERLAQLIRSADK